MVIMPEWSLPLMGQRERAVAEHPESRCLCVDRDGHRLEPWQRLIEMPDGEGFTIDARRRAIIG